MKSQKPPSVNAQLDLVQRRLANVEKEQAAEKDPLGLIEDQNTEKLVTEREKSDLLQALANPAVRRVFYRLMFDMAGILQDSSDPDPIVMAHHNGKRSLGLLLYNCIKEVDGGAFHQMEREALSNARSTEKQEDR